jgi:hypothetical protein
MAKKKNPAKRTKTSSATPEANPRRRRRRRSRRRRNPWDGDSALTTGIGAGVGSLLGGIAGAAAGLGAATKKVMDEADAGTTEITAGEMSSIALLPLLSWAGSIAGGAIGGHIGAPDKRDRRGAIGGALGGMLGPIGAAAGGAVGGGHTSRKSNPAATTVALVVGGVAVAGAAVYGLRKWSRAMRLPPGEPVGGDTYEPVQ